MLTMLFNIIFVFFLDLEVKITPASHSFTRATLKCSSSCRLPGQTSIWYKNNDIITENTLEYSNYFHSQDSVSCAVKGLEDFSSPLLCEFTALDFSAPVLYHDLTHCIFYSGISITYNKPNCELLQ